jgi:hypothetical protein
VHRPTRGEAGDDAGGDHGGPRAQSAPQSGDF